MTCQGPTMLVEIVQPPGEEACGQGFADTIADQKNILIYRQSVEKITTVFNSVAAGKRVTHDAIDQLAKDLLGAIEDNQNTMIQLLLVERESAGNLADNAIKSSLPATIMGKGSGPCRSS